MESVEKNYPEAWADYRRRRSMMFAALVLAIPVVALIGIPLTSLLKNDAPATIVSLTVFAFWATCAFRLARWRCPRCGKVYHRRGMIGRAFSPRCLNCGLPKRF